MTKPLSAQRWANDLSVLLKAALGADRFPVDVKEVAREISQKKFPDDPITMIKGADLPGFEGALMPAPLGKKGWGIVYNNAISSAGRINFTLGHEFGHYLLHRLAHPKGLQCSSEDMARWESEFGQVEHQANEFAATLLMPLDDFRSQIDAKGKPGFDALGSCADRYGVSLIAAILRWLQYTEKRAILVVSKDGFVLWARSSESALRTGLFFKTRGRPPIAIPTGALAARRSLIAGHAGEGEHDGTVWLDAQCKEHVLFSEQYDFTISLLHFDDAQGWRDTLRESEVDTGDRVTKRSFKR